MAPFLFSILSGLALLSSSSASPLDARQTVTGTIIPSNSMTSSSLFSEFWSFNYPWGDTHNGAAIMDSAHAVLNTGANSITMTAVPTSGLGTTTSGGQTISLHYRSGTIFAKPQFTSAAGGGFDVTASFIAPVVRGTWPAFWLTAVNSWPPEIDVAEWKGDGDISFNTFNTSSSVTAHDVKYSNPGSVHTVKAEVRSESDGSTVKVNFFLDGVLQMTQFGSDTVGKALWLIIDLQMEGSSGSPGPTTNTTYTISNINAVSYNP